MPENLERRLGADRRPPPRVVGQVLGADESPPAVAQVDEHPDASAHRDRDNPARYLAAERKPLQGGVPVFRLGHALTEPFRPPISCSGYAGRYLAGTGPAGPADRYDENENGMTRLRHGARRLPDGGAARVVVIGMGFAGLATARRLTRAGLRVTLVARNVYSTFQPLLYQVATGA